MRFPLTAALLLPLLLLGCSPASATPAPVPLTVQYSPSAGAWLPALVNCAGNVTINFEQRQGEALDPKADLEIRIGQPIELTSPAFRIGSEDLLVVINPQNPVHTLSEDQVRGLFSGQIRNWKDVKGADSPVEVWAYPEGDDVEQVFEQVVLEGGPITSTARLANSPDEMAQGIAKDSNAVGVLSRHWITENVREAFKAASAPVLAITPSAPQGASAALLTCLQK
jgi:hypothetical protein